MALEDDLERIAAAAAAHGKVSGVLAAEPGTGARRYLVALGDGDELRWLVLDDGGAAVSRRADVRETASIVAICELAEELAGEALELERTIGTPPRVATPALLDAIGAAALQQGSPLPEGLRGATAAVEAFVRDVERGYLLPLG